MTYVQALRRNYRWRNAIRAVRSGNLLRAVGNVAFAASEWRLIRDNAR